MSKDRDSHAPLSDGTPDTASPIGRRRAVTALVVVALAALLLCVSALFSGCSPDATQEPAEETAIETPAPQEPEGAANEACDHDWTVTYKTVHHYAVTHTETVEPVYSEETTYHTVCNECQQVIDGTADQHIRETGHSGYSTNVPITDEVLVSEGYTHEVTDTPAYDETVADEMVCTLCGETRPLDGTVQ